MLELFHPKCKGPELKAKGGRHPKTDLGQGRLTYRSLGKFVDVFGIYPQNEEDSWQVDIFKLQGFQIINDDYTIPSSPSFLSDR